jgi:isoamylase
MQSRKCWALQVGSVFRGTFDCESEPFDWEGVKAPGHHHKDLIIYEVPVRTFTASASSGLPAGERGTYLGLAKKADHLVELGVTAVELLPVFEYDELEFQRDKNARDHMINVWGYSHITFMAPMSRFGSNAAGPAAAAREFKQMVKTCATTLSLSFSPAAAVHPVHSEHVPPFITW